MLWFWRVVYGCVLVQGRINYGQYGITCSLGRLHYDVWIFNSTNLTLTLFFWQKEVHPLHEIKAPNIAARRRSCLEFESYLTCPGVTLAISSIITDRSASGYNHWISCDEDVWIQSLDIMWRGRQDTITGYHVTRTSGYNHWLSCDESGYNHWISCDEDVWIQSLDIIWRASGYNHWLSYGAHQDTITGYHMTRQDTITGYHMERVRIQSLAIIWRGHSFWCEQFPHICAAPRHIFI